MNGETLNLLPALPELILAIGGMALLMLGVFQGDKSYRQIANLSILLLLVCMVVMINQVGGDRDVTFNGMFVTDAFAVFAKTLVYLGSAVAILIAGKFLSEHGIAKFEYPVLIVFATLGMLIMVSANNLMSLYVGLELQSLSLYVLAAMNRDRLRSTEAGLKYFVLGALSSGMLLYGISLIYGFSGTTDFDVLATSIKGAESMSIGIVIGMVFLLAGLAFKVSAVPFHMWTPDVYEGSPTPVTAFFAAAPKVAAMALLVRVLINGFPGMVAEWQQIIVFISIASMLVGSFVALVQTNIKRLMAYSSIGHIGYALVGVAAGTQDGIEAVLVYLAIYLTMTLGAFAAILTMRKNDGMVENIEDLAGLSTTNLPMAVAISIFMFSLAGIPLLAGFFGKWFIFLAAVEAGMIPLAIIGFLASVVACYYYLRVVKVMFFDESAGAFEGGQGQAVSAVVGVSALVNSPVSFLLIGSLGSAAAWAANSLLF
ncbi:MAG: NADH-quinone oxidoreductase subunit NuoN [Kordiimonadaceae bacterium]|nr:NADH-quinone oxidoreductase subunit NuoN [Kordiimonadaceae bacterium]MBO6570347.1 NADH-quinone oxidoreductase subunit NuoN [Kordiimonadaceae bacterium]MBO6965555.1 NADH-quinone oxidoreductase subunit NuoN [Kordiimonadaceae bacterium]